MNDRISTGLEATFICHGVLGLGFGLVYMLVPVTWGDLIGWPALDPPVSRLLGAATLGYATTSFLAVASAKWEAVRILVVGEMVWCGLAAIIIAGAVFLGGVETFAMLYGVIFGGFALAFGYYYFRH